MNIGTSLLCSLNRKERGIEFDLRDISIIEIKPPTYQSGLSKSFINQVSLHSLPAPLEDILRLRIVNS